MAATATTTAAAMISTAKKKAIDSRPAPSRRGGHHLNRVIAEASLPASASRASARQTPNRRARGEPAIRLLWRIPSRVREVSSARIDATMSLLA